MSPTKVNPYGRLLTNVKPATAGGDGPPGSSYYDLSQLNDPRYQRLPYSIRVVLEAAIRNCDGFQIRTSDVDNILDWEINAGKVEIPFKPARVILQDLTGVPAVVDFAAMRDAFKKLGGDPLKINPLCPTDLVIDHSVQVDFSRATPNGLLPVNRQQVTAKNSSVINNSKSKVPILCPQCSETGECALASRSIQSLSVSKKVPMNDKTEKRTFGISKNTKFHQNNTQRHHHHDRHDLVNAPQSVHLISDMENLHLRVQPSPLYPHNSVKIREENCPFHLNRSIGAESLQKNQNLEFDRNRERFAFLKWSSRALKNMRIIPPGSGIVHQVNLEYLARVVFRNEDGLLFPDSLVGADSHTTMINGLGIVGWGVGGIEAEAVMLGQAISMVLPEVVGYRIVGHIPPLATSTDVVLTITKHLREIGVVGKFVEFFGSGVAHLSIADRATIANMCPEYGATIGFFPVDDKALEYLRQTGRDERTLDDVESYLKAVNIFRHDFSDTSEDPKYSHVVELDLNSIVPSLSGPKRPHDRVAVSEMKRDFFACLTNKIGFKGYGLSDDKTPTQIPFIFEGQEYVLRHGSVVIAAATSCTNTSNPSVMLGAGLLAKKAVERGLAVAPYIKTSLSPGSGVVTYYLQESGVYPYLSRLGFDIVGYGCMTCIGNSGPLPDPVVEAIEKGDLVAASVLSGNRNFEGRVHPNTRANYLASPLLVVAYALAGTVVIDFEKEPIGHDADEQPIFLRDIWPSREEIQAVEQRYVIPAMFQQVYANIQNGNERWNSLATPEALHYPWDAGSTYIKCPPFFDSLSKEVPPIRPIEDARVLLYLGDSVTTDHISPAGTISRTSPTAKFLSARSVASKDFNSYGSRRGNDAIMVRGTFANIRLVNKFLPRPGPRTIYLPTGEEMDIFDAAERYKIENVPLIILAGKEYGSGSSRDWAAKGPLLLGVRAVIAESYERIHRTNLIGMGIVPLQFKEGESSDSIGLTGQELFTIEMSENVSPRQEATVRMDNGRSFQVIVRFDTDVELEYFRHGGILQYMLRRMLALTE